MRRIIIVTGIVATAALGVVGTAAASDTNAVITRPTSSYTSPSDVTMPVRSLEPGTPVLAQCFTEGQQLRGNSTWFRITKNGDSGFVHRDTISGELAGLRHC
ncbi:MAG: hypothetical protein OJJ54_16280 [Pseudonocardia sp.]|nr:hypothetical protein [Pseudonocardia sp.]